MLKIIIQSGPYFAAVGALVVPDWQLGYHNITKIIVRWVDELKLFQKSILEK